MLPVKRDKISPLYLLQAVLSLCHPLGWQPAPQSMVSGPILSVAARLLQVLCYKRLTLVQAAGKQHGWLSLVGDIYLCSLGGQVWDDSTVLFPKDERKGSSMELPSMAFCAVLFRSQCYRAWLLAPKSLISNGKLSGIERAKLWCAVLKSYEQQLSQRTEYIMK